MGHHEKNGNWYNIYPMKWKSFMENWSIGVMFKAKLKLWLHKNEIVVIFKEPHSHFLLFQKNIIVENLYSVRETE